jgi:hypothetical protein
VLLLFAPANNMTSLMACNSSLTCAILVLLALPQLKCIMAVHAWRCASSDANGILLLVVRRSCSQLLRLLKLCSASAKHDPNVVRHELFSQCVRVVIQEVTYRPTVTADEYRPDDDTRRKSQRSALTRNFLFLVGIGSGTLQH